jgi:GNAT superfamily N-acetyltransferase
MPRLRKNEYPRVPPTQLTEVRWRIPGLGILRVEPGISGLLKQVDQEWLDLHEEDDDESASWQFHELVLKHKWEERFVVMEEDKGPMAVWLDHDRLVHQDAYRLNFFKVRPDMQGKGLGRFTLGLIGIHAREKNAERIVFQSLPTSKSFYMAVGATDTDWQGHEGSLTNLQIGAAALKKLEGVVNGYRIQG